MREPLREGRRVWHRYSKSSADIAGIGTKIEDTSKMAIDVLAIAVSGASRGRVGVKIVQVIAHKV